MIGLMTGSSLDGVDVAYCTLEENKGQWSFKIEAADCIPYQPKWRQRLQSMVLENAIGYLKTETAFGHYLGEVVRDFVAAHQLEGKVDFVASHGQTIFHQPENQMTSQIGDGASIAVESGLPVICNFRTHDVALHGQGTPIAPIGDVKFFGDYQFCLNLGGIANISGKPGGERVIGFDICGCNSVLNSLASEIGVEYDKNGEIAKTGNVQQPLLDELNKQWYYEKTYPKSLGGGWVTKVFMPMFRKHRYGVEDKLRTAVEHIAIQIGKDISSVLQREQLDPNGHYKMLVTGGGAFNQFLMERIAYYSPVEIHVPDRNIVKFKEALIIALMGCLRLRGEVNVLRSVTGAREDSIGGQVYLSARTPLRTS